MPPSMSPERAEIVGLDALGWLVSDQAGIARFLTISGVTQADLREAADSPELTVAILDFLLAHEDLLLAFCENTGTPAPDLQRARHALGP